MKKIINGKMYNTDTAECIGADAFSTPRDFKYWREKLYRKHSGELFLYGIGGALTKYGRRVGENGYCGGEDITPLTEDAAKTWAEEHLDADRYEAIFGAVPE